MLPLDPAYPAGRIAYMLTDSNPVAVLTTRAVGEDLPGEAARVVLDDPGTAAGLAGLDGANLAAGDEVVRPLLSHPACAVGGQGGLAGGAGGEYLRADGDDGVRDVVESGG